MCGIAGVTSRGDSSALDGMVERMHHRGPDGRGIELDQESGVGLGMCRLAILDPIHGQQPMALEEEALRIVFNGEIYNSPQLRTTLEMGGCRFTTRNSDTEVLLHLYAEKGEDMLADLNGMFAFVIHDRRRGILFGARDRMGIKPLYYADRDGRFAFASELKSLLLLSWVGRDIDFESLYHYLSLQFVPAPSTILQDVKKIPAGHSFTYDLGNEALTVRRFWSLPVSPDDDLPPGEWEQALRTKVAACVRRWTLSDVPIACSLSGGLDSSGIVGALCDGGYDELATYTVGFRESAEDETCRARAVAEKWGTDHHEVVLSPDVLLDDLETMVWHLDEPYGGGLPSWYIYREVGRTHKVVLTGTGGDELFGNYAKWRIYERPGLFRTREILRRAGESGSLREFARAVSCPHGYYYHRYASDVLKDRVMFGDGGHGVRERTEALLERRWVEAGMSNPRDTVACIDFQLQLPEEFLAMTDKFSMAHSVEARTPLLDHELVELVFRMPAAVRTSARDPKQWMRAIVRDLVPPELLDAPKKGFVLPLLSWTRGELRPMVESLLGPERLDAQGIFSNRVWKGIVRPHISRDVNRTQQVWTLLMFQLWCKVFKVL